MSEKTELAGQDRDRATVEAETRAFILSIPQVHALNIRIEEIGLGEVRISMPWDADLVGDPRSLVLHGGVISTLMDTCSGAAVLCHRLAPRRTVTMDLRIDYMRSARPGQRITAHAVCHHMTRHVAFVRAVATDEDTDHPVAMATGSFAVEVPDA